MTPVSALHAVVFVDGQPVPCSAARLVLDESWSPYAQAEVTIPYTAALAAAVDPHAATPRRFVLQLERRWHDTCTLADLSEAWAGLTLATLSAEWTGYTLATLTDLWGDQWEAGWKDPDVITADLVVRARSIDYGESTITLRGASDELLAQDARTQAVVESSWLPDWVVVMLAAAGVTVGARDFTPAAALNAPVGATGPRLELTWTDSPWSEIQDALAAVGLRLWCDEARTWRVTDVTAAPSTTVALTRAQAAGLDADRDGDFADVLVWVGRGTNNDGDTITDFRTYPDPIPVGQHRFHVVTEDYGPVGDSVLSVLPQPSELAARLARLQSTARVLTVTAAADLTVRPGQAFTTGAPSLPGGLAGVIGRVEWSLPDDEMTITTRSTQEA